jgi:hypothetical protein
VNTSATKVTVVLDVDEGLSPELAARVRERYGGTVRATSSAFRSQWQNRKAALDRLGRRLDEILVDDPTRVSGRHAGSGPGACSSESRQAATFPATRRPTSVRRGGVSDA